MDKAIEIDSKPAVKYAKIRHSFNDLWEEREVEFEFQFAKPSKQEMKRLQDTAVRNNVQATTNLLMATVHPDEKQALKDAIDNYPGIAMSYATALIKAVGLSADLGN